MCQLDYVASVLLKSLDRQGALLPVLRIMIGKEVHKCRTRRLDGAPELDSVHLWLVAVFAKRLLEFHPSACRRDMTQ